MTSEGESMGVGGEVGMVRVKESRLGLGRFMQSRGARLGGEAVRRGGMVSCSETEDRSISPSFIVVVVELTRSNDKAVASVRTQSV